MEIPQSHCKFSCSFINVSNKERAVLTRCLQFIVIFLCGHTRGSLRCSTRLPVVIV